MGFVFVKSTQSTTNITIFGEHREIELLETFSFTSKRKRMSVVVRESGMIKMYSKGADNVIKDLLAHDQTFNLDRELTEFSVIGLRTLLIAMRIISESEYQSFKDAVQNLPKENTEEALEEEIKKLESGLYLIGSTAVLDRLQEQVPETIRDLIRASTSSSRQT